jgi:outer membrane protein assembly factor BamB
MSLAHHSLIVSAGIFLGLIFTNPLLAGNWTTFAGSPTRLNYVGDETVLTPATVPNLKVHWSRNLGGPSETQALFMQQVATASGTHDVVFQTTQNGRVAALNAMTGKLDWSVQLPTFVATCSAGARGGVFGTPTIDPDAGLMYVVDGMGQLHALDIASGMEAPSYPVQVIGSADLAAGNYNHSSPTMVGSTLYITTSAKGYCERSATGFRGSVIAFDTQSRTVLRTFYSMTAPASGGGIWGPGGALADSVTGNLFVATGNALARPFNTPLAESVVSLAGDLTPIDWHSPTLPLHGGDDDFGSTPTPIDPAGCTALLSVMNKTGNLYLYPRTDLHDGPIQTISMSKGGGSSTFIGMAAYDPVLEMLFIDNPIASSDGTYPHGAVALIVTKPACTLATAWQSSFGTGVFSVATRATDPLVAGGVVWFVSGAGKSVLAFSEVGGALLWSSGNLLTANTPAPVTVANGQMFVQSGTQLYAWGL